ncbi:hypothetical protein PPYR_06832 [Photinus pyralis]|uniref:Uncharacterized protein n=1 Tax=Photinus pyralis TaxID=7054 RepID=A0A1Y1KSH8_PHOPY|nr:uncharacterized protein LOC116168721 [Photinus pyralis]KAB0798952.1 hypothetical protein PPYR_06832 [Photinus pyralis]
MEYNQKARGQKHHKNKARYKPKHEGKKKGNDQENQVARRSLEPKKDKSEFSYTSSDDFEDDELISETEAVALNDFTLLAEAPISVGGHFQFKRDRNMEAGCDFKSLSENDLFSLDLNVLQYSLGCVPFYERCGISKDHFTESEIEAMDARAHSNKVQYESYLKLSAIIKKDSGSSSGDFHISQSTNDTDNKITDISTREPHSACEESTHSALGSSKLDVDVNKVELEDWLDDILGN